MNDYDIYKLVKSCLEQCQELGITLAWRSDRWMALYNSKLVIGYTASELTLYIQGIRDGMNFDDDAKTALPTEDTDWMFHRD